MFPRVLEFAACWGAAEKCTRCRLGQSCLPAAQRPFDRGQQRRVPAAAHQQRGAGNKEQTNKEKKQLRGPEEQRELCLGWVLAGKLRRSAHTYSVFLK